jgi:hypothetical protein
MSYFFGTFYFRKSRGFVRKKNLNNSNKFAIFVGGLGIRISEEIDDIPEPMMIIGTGLIL